MDDGVGSYEQKSTIEPESRGNRVIIANRREPNIYWATSRDSGGGAPTNTTSPPAAREQPPAVPQQASCLPSCFCSSLFCGLCTSQDPNGVNEKSLGRGRGLRQQRRPSEHSGQTLSYSSSAGASQSTYDFGPFVSNVWKTSKYTIVNFLFKNLYEQFRRMANFYFLVTAIVQIAMPYSPIGPATSLIPLAFVVGTTAMKQAYEDYLRHKLDNEVNHRICCVLRENKQLVKVRSRDIRVGDIVYVKNNEEIPCDMILLAASGTGDRCYITTANLDGETSLKNRTCFQIRQQVGDIEQINDTMLVIECEKPNATLYEFNGYLRAPKDQAAYESLTKDIRHLDDFRDPNNTIRQQQPVRASLGSDHKRLSVISTIFQRIKVASFNSKLNKQLSANQLRTIGANTLVENNSLKHIDIPLDISNLLLRASRLRNTGYVYGLAVYTGPDTRLAYNSHVKPNKFSSLESRVNKFLGIAFTLLLLLTLISALKHRKNDANLPVASTIAALRADSFLQLFMAYFVLYNYLVPISLYVTLEFVKFFGTISVLEDKKLQGQVNGMSNNCSVGGGTTDVSASLSSTTAAHAESEHSKQQQARRAKKEAQQLAGPKCNTSDLNEDLGQVEVLFSDKTGTLTENKMHFMACSIQGHLYRAIAGQIYEQPEGLCYMPQLSVARKLSRISANRYAALAADLAVHASPRSIGGGGGSTGSGPKSASRSSRSSSERMAKLPANQRPFDHRYVPPLREFKTVDSLDQHNRLSEFLLCLCLCSTITLNEQTPIEECLPRASGASPTAAETTAKYDYQSASPDEESLITAAASFGVIVCKASERECFVAIRRPSVMDKHPPEVFRPVNRQFKPLVETKLSNDQYLVRHFERLITFEFNSVRKKMSVLYRDCDNDCVVMFTKGSESVLDCIATPADESGGGAKSFTSPPPRSKSPSQSSSYYRQGQSQSRQPIVMTAAAAARDYERVINVTLGHFEAFSKSGLRTMLVAMRAVTMQEYEKLNSELREARLLPMQDARELRMAMLYRGIESNMTLIGATAVEDSLQEGVPETIAQLKEAGIKVWLLTGDKVETAISVAYLCKLLDRNMNLLQLVRQQDSKSCKELLTSYANVIKTALLYGEDEEQDSSMLIASQTRNRESVSKRPQQHSRKYDRSQSRGGIQRQQSGSDSLKQQSSVLSRTSSINNFNINKLPSTLATNEMDMPRFAMIADGRSLHYAMKYAKEELEFVVTRCVCVLGCRLSPLQKAEIVDMIKNSADEPITAAIGDGANDVSMIQEAHVGIGISGKEGRQAVNSSDFAINRFHMISRLFLVHGHLFYHRTAHTVHYFFYKNLLFIMPQFLYSFYNLSSATSLYHPIMMIAFNMLLTSFPILLYGLFEINIPMSLLETYPRFYRINNRNKKMGYTTFLTWLLMGALQALIAFFLTQFIWDSPEPIIEANKITSPMYFSSIVFTALIFCVTIKLYFISRNPGRSFYCASVLSCLILPITLYVFSLFDLSRLFSDNSLHQQYAPLLSSPTYWLAIAMTTAAMVIPDMIECIRRQIAYYRMINSSPGAPLEHHSRPLVFHRRRASLAGLGLGTLRARARAHLATGTPAQAYISNIGDKNNKDGSQPKRSKRRATKHAKDNAAKEAAAAAAAAAALAAAAGGKDNKEDSATSDNRGTGYQDIIGSLVAREFKLIKLLGSGSYGAVYLGKNIVTQEQVAVKLEHKATKAPQLPLEYRFIKMIGPVEGFPRIIRIDECAGTYHAMVMELLGPSLEEVFNVCERRLSLKSVLYLSLQLLTRFQTLHAKNIIYRDVKPENFLLGRPGMDKEHIVHIIDYGLAKEYINPESGTHIAFRGQRGAIGTARYMSVNTHMGKEQSRRDDLEALGYVLIYLTRGSLPWQGLPATDHRERMRKIGEMKRRLPVEEICERCPDEFASYLRYVKHLDFYEAPDYDYLKKLFYDLFVANRFVDDGVYDWSGKFESRTT